MSEEYQQILRIFGDSPKKMLDVVRVFADEESRILLQKLTGPHSPLLADNLPYKKSKGTKLSNLSKLQVLVKIGLVEEKDIREGKKTITRYHATQKAIDIMKDPAMASMPQ